jgi:hypothetical protein
MMLDLVSAVIQTDGEDLCLRLVFINALYEWVIILFHIWNTINYVKCDRLLLDVGYRGQIIKLIIYVKDYFIKNQKKLFSLVHPKNNISKNIEIVKNSLP